MAYRQAYVESELGAPDWDGAFEGQRNGLCGAALPGRLFLRTGLHTGRVGFTVEAHGRAPDVSGEWEDVVEASFTPGSPEVVLVEWGGGDGRGPFPLGLDRGDWRIRYCARGMDASKDADAVMEDEDPVDHYLLQFWPAAPAPDRVVRQTSAHAAYWHGELRRRQSEAEKRTTWGGRPPDARLRQVGGDAQVLAAADRVLLDQLLGVEATTQRAVAVWAASRACEIAGVAAITWVTAALQALERGDPLPPPFDNPSDAMFRLVREPLEGSPETVVLRAGGPRLQVGPRISMPFDAMKAVCAAADPDPLRAAVDALVAAGATFGDLQPALLAEVGHRFFASG